VIAHENQDEAMIAAMKTGRLEHALQRNQSLQQSVMRLKEGADRAYQSHLDRIAGQQNAWAIAAANRAAAQSRVESKPLFIKQADGTMTQFIPKFDESGQIANLPPGAKIVGTHAGSDTRGGAQNARYAFNITESYAQAARDLLNVSEMPKGTVLGAFAGMTGMSGDTLQRSLSTTLARKMTDGDARYMQQVTAGLEMNMARALGGGYAQSSAQHLIEAYKQQIPKAGDSPVATAIFLSRVKQELDILAKAFHGHPGATEEWVGQMKNYSEQINKAIPYTVSDVLKASGRGRQTIGERFKSIATEPIKQALPTDIPSRPNEVPAGAKYSPSQDKWWWQDNGAWKSN